MRAFRIALVCLLMLGALAPTALCNTFHFTVTADPRSSDAQYDAVLAVMQSKIGGQGEFQVCVGDIDPPDKLRAKVTKQFGTSAVWYPVVGNHDLDQRSMPWIRDEYTKGHDGRAALKTHVKGNGPAGCAETTYSFDSGNAHFIVLNEYWDGSTKPGSDIAEGGNIVPELYRWLKEDLAANKKPIIFVFGHEPAYPQHRHVGDSLDAHKQARDAFWKLLESAGVQAFFCGHTHFYSKLRQPGGHVWQIDAGNTRSTDSEGNTFVNVTVSETAVRYDVWRDGGKGDFKLADTWTEMIGK